MNLSENVAEFRRLDIEAERNEAAVDKARWTQARLASEAIADGASQVQYAEAVEKSPEHIRRLRKAWTTWGSTAVEVRPNFTDAYRMAYTRTDDVEASQEVDRLRKRLPKAPDKRAKFLAEQLNDNPDIVKDVIQQVISKPTLSSRRVEKVVADRNRERRQRSIEWARKRAEAGAMPLPAYMSTMVVKINEWAIGLDGLVDHLDELPDGPGRDSVLRAIEHLIRAAEKWQVKLAKPGLIVLEGGKAEVG